MLPSKFVLNRIAEARRDAKGSAEFCRCTGAARKSVASPERPARGRRLQVRYSLACRAPPYESASRVPPGSRALVSHGNVLLNIRIADHKVITRQSEAAR